jgi:hypothetical protein
LPTPLMHLWRYNAPPQVGAREFGRSGGRQAAALCFQGQDIVVRLFIGFEGLGIVLDNGFWLFSVHWLDWDACLPLVNWRPRHRGLRGEHRFAPRANDRVMLEIEKGRATAKSPTRNSSRADIVSGEPAHEEEGKGQL